VENAILKGNRQLPADQQIPHWFPYQLRHTAATETESEVGLDEAQAQLGHKTADMTRRYSKAQLRIREELARNRRNPFDIDDNES
jgi:integrase